ncbi:hypothetical protein BDW67DRAFT_163814 [Aspergillus spinulosporus]
MRPFWLVRLMSTTRTRGLPPQESPVVLVIHPGPRPFQEIYSKGARRTLLNRQSPRHSSNYIQRMLKRETKEGYVEAVQSPLGRPGMDFDAKYGRARCCHLTIIEPLSLMCCLIRGF